MYMNFSPSKYCKYKLFFHTILITHKDNILSSAVGVPQITFRSINNSYIRKLKFYTRTKKRVI